LIVRVTDPTSPYCGQEFEGDCIYYDVYHTGNSPDLFIIKTPKGDERILSTQIDAEHYWEQRRQEYIGKLGADVGDTVIIMRSGSGYSKKDFDLTEPHKITKIDSNGYVTFDDAATYFRPDIEVIHNS
jgi:hypothetical protein